MSCGAGYERRSTFNRTGHRLTVKVVLESSLKSRCGAKGRGAMMMMSTIHTVASKIVWETLRPPGEMIARIRIQCRAYLCFDLRSYRAGMGCCALVRFQMLTQGKPAAYDLQQFGNPCPSLDFCALAIDRYALVTDIQRHSSTRMLGRILSRSLTAFSLVHASGPLHMRADRSQRRKNREGQG